MEERLYLGYSITKNPYAGEDVSRQSSNSSVIAKLPAYNLLQVSAFEQAIFHIQLIRRSDDGSLSQHLSATVSETFRVNGPAKLSSNI